MLSDGVATTGVEDLDRALGGLYWGDNVVWVCDGPDEQLRAPFFAAVVHRRQDYGGAAYVTVRSAPDPVRAAYPGLEVIDGRPRSSLQDKGSLLAAIRRFCREFAHPLLIFDSLGLMAEQWGASQATAFFARCCPMLLDLGAVAYWSLPATQRLRTLADEIERITQCVVVVHGDRLRIAKAEGRGPGVQGRLFRYSATDDGLSLTESPAAARVGTALRAYRLRRELSQTAVAKLAGVSPSAISQAERGERGLSLDTLLQLSGRLNVSLDELLGGEISPDYRIGRRHTLSDLSSVNAVTPLLDDAEAGLRAYLVSLQPGMGVNAPFPHKGPELTAVVTGLVQVAVGHGQPVLRAGEVLLAARRGIASWRNVGDSPAVSYWVLRD